MIIIDSLDKLNITEKTAVAIGKFDGVHQGHRYIVDRMNMQKRKGLKTAVLTFVPLPSVFFGFSDRMVLTTDFEKKLIFEELGVDYLVLFPFTDETSSIEPAVFIRDILVKRMNAAFIIAGSDMSFGKKGIGNMDMLISMSGLYGYKAEKIDKLMLGDVEISSTEIRRRISSMDIEGAAGMMGDGYYLYFNADDADININRTNGYISIDVKAEDNKILPASGVYYSRVCIDGGLYNSLCVFADTLTQHTNDAPEKKAASRFVRIYILDTEIPVSGTFRVDIFGLRRKFKSIETDINSLFLSNDELQVAKEYYLEKYM